MKLYSEKFGAMCLFIALGLFALYLSIFMPAYNTAPSFNWDVIPYVASVKYFEEKDIIKLHEFTFNEIKKKASNKSYHILSSKDHYRLVVSSDPKSLIEQLPFYQIRPIYTGLIYLLYKLGVNIVFATHFISGISVVLSVGLLYLMSVRYLKKSIVFFVPLIMIGTGFLNAARFSTPDSLATLAVIVSCYLYLSRQIACLGAFLPLIIGIRTDYILFVLPLYVVMFLFEKKYRAIIIFYFFLSIFIYKWIGNHYGNKGWATIFYFTLVDNMPYPLSSTSNMTSQVYFNYLLIGFFKLVAHYRFVVYVGMLIWCVFLLKKQGVCSIAVAINYSPYVQLIIISIFFIICHFFALPAGSHRFFTAQYVISFFSFLAIISEDKKIIKS